MRKEQEYQHEVESVYGGVTAEQIAVAKRKRIPKVEEYGTTFLC